MEKWWQEIAIFIISQAFFEIFLLSLQQSKSMVEVQNFPLEMLIYVYLQA